MIITQSQEKLSHCTADLNSYLDILTTTLPSISAAMMSQFRRNHCLCKTFFINLTVLLHYKQSGNVEGGLSVNSRFFISIVGGGFRFVETTQGFLFANLVIVTNQTNNFRNYCGSDKIMLDHRKPLQQYNRIHISNTPQNEYVIDYIQLIINFTASLSIHHLL